MTAKDKLELLAAGAKVDLQNKELITDRQRKQLTSEQLAYFNELIFADAAILKERNLYKHLQSYE